MLLQRFLHNGNTAPTLSQTTDYRQRRVLYSLYLSIPFDDNGQWTTDYGVLYPLSLSTTTEFYTLLYSLHLSRPTDNRLRSSTLSIPFDDYGVLYSSILSILFYTFYTLYTFRGQRTRLGMMFLKYPCNTWDISILWGVAMFCNCCATFI